jgi:molybdate transport system substrate-binding protein
MPRRNRSLLPRRNRSLLPRRNGSLLLLLVCAVLPTAGCASGDGAGDGSSDQITGRITVLAASSLTEAFTQIGKNFEAAHNGTRVVFSFAASSELAAQVEQGAPADVFASASPQTMAQVRRSGDTAGAPATFVRNTLEIAVPPDNPGDVHGLADFANRSLTVALCAPEVPCGAAAHRVFQRAGITPAPDTYEADVKATLAKVTIGEVDAALVYRTDVQAAGSKVKGIEFPEAADAVNDYPIAVLSDAPNPVTAQAFVNFVRSAAGGKVLTEAGFQLP